MSELDEEEISLTIIKAKVNKDGFLEVEFTKLENDTFSAHAVTIHRFVHEDLIRRFQALTSHLCLITEQVKPATICQLLEETGEFGLIINAFGELEGEPVPDDIKANRQLEFIKECFFEDKVYQLPCFANFRCTGFINKDSGLMLMGQKVLRSGKVLNLITPLTNIYEESDYDFSQVLHLDLQGAIREVELYLNGKGAGGDQLDLFSQDSDKAA